MRGRQLYIKATLSENVNLGFRIESKLYHIIHKKTEVLKTPVIINNFNRLEFLLQQLDWLNKCGIRNIYIIDNNSTYDPLIKYYKNCPFTVIKLDKNMGHEAIWKTHVFQRFMKQFYVYTDPDLIGTEDTPPDFMFYFFDVLKRFSSIDKIGFGLKTDDLPDHYPLKKKVLDWEVKFYEDKIEENLFRAPIDTTFALYRPGKSYQCWNATLRTGAPYLLKHLPWYEDHNNLSKESSFYMKQSSDASSWYQAVIENNKYADA